MLDSHFTKLCAEMIALVHNLARVAPQRAQAMHRLAMGAVYMVVISLLPLPEES